MSKIWNNYKNLLEKSKIIDKLVVNDFMGRNQHKIGISTLGLPIFFIKCLPNEDNITVKGYTLDLIDIKYNVLCKLVLDDQSEISDYYTIIALKSGSEYITKYFLEIVHLMVSLLPEMLTVAVLTFNMQNIIELFSSLAIAPLKSIQGLWAELLIIEKSENPSYLLDSWHYSNRDTFDFNDGIDKIEVKSTSMSRRIHRFSADQLLPNQTSKLIIASLLVFQTSKGKSVFDLCKKIEERIHDQRKIFLFRGKVGAILGTSIETATDIFFDYTQACDSCKYYQSIDIPNIKLGCIPSGISNIKFDCDLSSLNHTNSAFIDSDLFKSL